jgi:gluconokinase
MYKCPKVWIFCGVSGSGKSTIARLFSAKIEADFKEGDRRHSRSNIQKMISGTPLKDEDRTPWLAAIESDILESIDDNIELVITCSALKAKYRKQFMSLGQIQLIYIKVSKKILLERLQTRKDHYMSAEMLESQISAFEEIQPEEGVITIDGSGSIEEAMNDLMSKVTEQFPSLNQPWWERISVQT